MIERAAQDFLAALVFDRLFERFPSVRIASVENGSQFLPYLMTKLESERGPLGRLVNDEELSNGLSSSVQGIASTVSRLDAGEASMTRKIVLLDRQGR